MKGNPTAGILLIIGATLLIVIGVTDKGKQILQILFGTNTAGSGNEVPSGGLYSGSAADPNSVVPNAASYPGAHVGEKAASPVTYIK